MGLIYKAISPSAYYYIGKTINLDQRKRLHRNHSFNTNSEEYEYAFHRAIRKYGFEQIRWTHKSKNNIGFSGKRHSEETKRRISESIRSSKDTNET